MGNIGNLCPETGTTGIFFKLNNLAKKFCVRHKTQGAPYLICGTVLIGNKNNFGRVLYILYYDLSI